MFGLRTILSTLLLLAILLPVVAAAPFGTMPQHTAPTVSPLITSSVKLRVDADRSHSLGTGTIIDTRRNPRSGQQEALILTCGHIFRESQGRGRTEVHLFGDNSTVQVLGNCLYYCLETDLALVAIAPPHPVRAIPIAPPSYQIKPNQQVWSVGCDHGGNPSVRQHDVMSIDKIFAPRFHYVQVSQAPVSGRSGGGLFSSSGYLIGVCSTACPQVNDGHFIPPHVIRYVLDKVNLAHIHQNPSLGEPLQEEPLRVEPPRGAPLPLPLAQAPQTPPALAALAPLTPLAPIETVPMATAPTAMAAASARMYAEHRGGMSQIEQATLEEINRQQQEDNEVIVIIRSRTNPEKPSDVIFLNGASDQFLDALVR